MTKLMPLLLILILTAGSAWTGTADVLEVKVEKSSAGVYRFDVTLRHADKGWDHYANKWDVVGPDGTILGTRVLHHPHVNEQPFTRSLSNVKISDGVDKVSVRGHDSVHGYSGNIVTLDIPR